MISDTDCVNDIFDTILRTTTHKKTKANQPLNYKIQNM